jgi:hypothetical protein
MNYQSDCFCGGECQKPCVAIKQLKEAVDELNAMTEDEIKYLEVHFADGEY